MRTSGGVEVRIAAQRLNDGRTEFALQLRGTDGEWGERILPKSRFFPADPVVGRWLASSPLTVRPPGDDEEAAATDEVGIAAQGLDDGRTDTRITLLQPGDNLVGWVSDAVKTATFEATAPSDRIRSGLGCDSATVL